MCATPSSLEWAAAIKNNWSTLLLNSSQKPLWDNAGKSLWIIVWWLRSSGHYLFLKTYSLSFSMRLHLPLWQEVGLFLGFCPKDPEKRKHQKWIVLHLLIQLLHPIAWHWKFSGKEGSWEKAKYQVSYTHALLMSKHHLQEILKAGISHMLHR